MAKGGKGLSSGELDGGARAAAKGVNALSSAFGDLSKKGEISAASINQVAGSLAMVNPVLGLVAASVGAVVQSFKMLEELELKDSLALFGTGAKAAVIDFERFTTTLQAGAGETGELKDKLKDLANEQFNLRSKTALFNAEAARQNQLVAEGKVEEAQATAALAAYGDTLRSQLPYAAQRVDTLKQEIDEIRKQTAATKQAAEAERRWTESHEAQGRMFDAQTEARRQAGLLDGGMREALEDETFARQQLVAEMQHEMDTTGHVTSTQLELLQAHERSIATLEMQIDVMDRFGSMALSAVGSVATDAYDQYADAVDRVIDGHNAFAKSSGRAMQVALAVTMRKLGQEAAAEAGMEGARALAAYATHRYADAANHGAAAAAFLAVAATAGVGAGALSVKPPSGGGGEGGNGGGTGPGAGPRAGTSVVVNPVIIGDIDDAGATGLARRIRAAIEKGDA